MKKLLSVAGLVAMLFSFSALGQGTPSSSSAPEAFSNKQMIGPTNSIVNLSVSGNGFSAPQLNHWRAALARVSAGTGRGRLLLVGDSTTTGAGAGTSGTTNLVGAFAKSRTTYLTKRLNDLGIPTSNNSFISDQNVTAQGVTLPSYDPRIAMGANWALGVDGTIGGRIIAYSTGAVNNFSFTPVGAIDTFIVYWIRTTALGSCTANVDGGSSLGTITMGGVAASIQTSTFTVTKGTHTINLVPNNDGALYLLAIIAYDSTTPAIDIIQAGVYGATSANWNSTGQAWHPILMFPTLLADLTIDQLTINDSNGGTTPATYTTNMQAVITAELLSGDVILESGIPSNTTQATNGTLAAIIAALRALAVGNKLPFFDINARWTSYVVTNPIMPYFDLLHATTVGYADVGQMEANLLNQ